MLKKGLVKYYFLFLFLLVLVLFFWVNQTDEEVTFFAATKSLGMDVCVEAKESLIIPNIYEGLTRIDNNGKLVEGVAYKWEQDGKRWTFFLRDNAKWSNGKKVKAEDFVEGIKYRLENNAYDMKQLIYLENSKDIGVWAKDETTLVFELDKENINFPYIVSSWQYYPIYKKDIYTTVYNGPFVPEIRDDGVKLKKSSSYWNKKNINIDTIKIVNKLTKEEAYSYFMDGKIDFMFSEEKDDLIEKDKIISFPRELFYYIKLNENGILRNLNLRKAILNALDIKKIEQVASVDVDYKNFYVPKWFYYNSKEVEPDLEKAIKYLEIGMNELNVNEIEPLKVLVSNTKNGKIQEKIIKNITDRLGIKIRIFRGSNQIIRQQINSGDYDFYIDSMMLEYRNFNSFKSYWIGNSNLLGDLNFVDMEFEKFENVLIERVPYIPLYVKNNYLISNNKINKLIYGDSYPKLDFYFAEINK